MKTLLSRGMEVLNPLRSVPDVVKKFEKEKVFPPKFMEFLKLFEVGDWDWNSYKPCGFYCNEEEAIRQICALEFFEDVYIENEEFEQNISSLFTYDELLSEYRDYLDRDQSWHQVGFIIIGYFDFGSENIMLGMADHVKDEIWRCGADYKFGCSKLADDIFELFSKAKIYTCEGDFEELCGEDILECGINLTDLYRNLGEDFYRIKNSK